MKDPGAETRFDIGTHQPVDDSAALLCADSGTAARSAQCSSGRWSRLKSLAYSLSSAARARDEPLATPACAPRGGAVSVALFERKFVD
jgi:hypothetical protein